VRQPIGRIAIIAGAVVLGVLALLFPPWHARAIRTTTRYAAVAGVSPATVVDTVSWNLSFESIFSPPRAPLSSSAMHSLAMRAASGDARGRAELRRIMEPFERDHHVPDIIRTSGELWRDSVLAAAGIPSVSSYEASFTLDDRWIAARLIAIVAIAGYLERRRLRRWRVRRDENH
jgi:hypothetical protein